MGDKMLLPSITKDILNAQADKNLLTRFASEINENIETLRKMKADSCEMAQVRKVQKIIETKYEIRLIPKQKAA